MLRTTKNAIFAALIILKNFVKEEIAMKKMLIGSIALVCIALLIGGCSKGTNIFGWMAPTGGSTAASVANGDSLYASADYSGAMAAYLAVCGTDPNASGAADYGYVKAYCKSAGLDLAAFLQNYSNSNGAPAFVAGPVSNRIIYCGTGMQAGDYMLIDSATKPFGLNLASLEKLADVIIKYLKPIADGTVADGYKPASMTGIDVNLAFAFLLRGMFTIVDPTLDGSLDYNFKYTAATKTTDLYAIDTNNVPQGAPITTATAQMQAGKAGAKSDLASSIAYLNKAIAASTDGTTALWTSVRNVLTDVQTKIDSL